MEMDYLEEIQAEADRYKHLYEIFKERAHKAEKEVARLQEALRAEREENLWNAFNVGSIRRDGKWIDCGMSDAEWLIREIGLDPNASEYNPEEIKRRIPLAAKRAATTKEPNTHL